MRKMKVEELLKDDYFHESKDGGWWDKEQIMKFATRFLLFHPTITNQVLDQILAIELTEKEMVEIIKQIL